jgi:CheY-like chemotaxis protein
MVKIFLIDDDEINNFISTKIIKKAYKDAIIHAFLNGKTALDYIESGADNHPDIILLDNNMPIMHGLEFLKDYQNKDLFKIFPHTVIIATIYGVFANDLNNFRKYPIDDIISKPLNSLKIQEIIQLWESKKRK